jgi:DNA processing protein
MEIKSTTTDQQPYLRILDHYTGMPRRIFYKGSLPLDRRPTVAIVGSRKPTSYGKGVTYDFAYSLAQKGVIIISGLAFGVDAAAHRGALDAGGITIAILAGGLDSIYPKSHTRLANEIIEKGGVLISEYPSGTSTRQFQFLARNRLISGLADGVVITEAAARSGALSTINHALDQSKEVFVVPGNITSILSAGPNKLLKQGAQPALSQDDILEVIAPELLTQQTQLALGDSPVENKIITLLKEGVRDGDQLQLQTGADASSFLTALTMLEINKLIRSVGGNQWILAQ